MSLIDSNPKGEPYCTYAGCYFPKGSCIGHCKTAPGKPTIDEQIAAQKQLLRNYPKASVKGKAILASLKKLQAIDTLQSALKLAQEERDKHMFLSKMRPTRNAEDYERAEKAEAENAALRQQLKEYAAEALEDVEGWAAYASEYFRAKWNLDADINKWRKRAAIKEQS